MFDIDRAGQQIAALRRRKGLTQEAVGEALGVSPQAISKWENGHTMPEAALLPGLATLLDTTIDNLLVPRAYGMLHARADYEYTLLPRLPVAAYTGPQWPKSLSYPALLATLKLFLGLEARRDYQGRQLHDDEEYILQAGVTLQCFTHPVWREEGLRAGLALYGMDFTSHSRTEYSREDFTRLAWRSILEGHPVIVEPTLYVDTLFATGFSGEGERLRGLGFLDGDDGKNAGATLLSLQAFEGWQETAGRMLTLAPVGQPVPLAQACRAALHKGLDLLKNAQAEDGPPLLQMGMALYDNWQALLHAEQAAGQVQIDCIYPHIYILYENKLRTQAFFERCGALVPGLRTAYVASAVQQYGEMLSLIQTAMEVHQGRQMKDETAHDQRLLYMNVLRRCRECEQVGIDMMRKALEEGR